MQAKVLAEFIGTFWLVLGDAAARCWRPHFPRWGSAFISIPVTNTSVNPARSTGPALLVGGWALQQLWLFWAAPIAGAVLAGFTYKAVFEQDGKEEPDITGRPTLKTTIIR